MYLVLSIYIRKYHTLKRSFCLTFACIVSRQPSYRSAAEKIHLVVTTGAHLAFMQAVQGASATDGASLPSSSEDVLGAQRQPGATSSMLANAKAALLPNVKAAADTWQEGRALATPSPDLVSNVGFGDGDSEPEYETSTTSIHGTVAEMCRIKGKGLSEATVRQASYFWVEACDAQGRKRTEGGDAFFVHVRGPSTVRARVTDNQDGSYLVVWKPSVSGSYVIAVSLFGEPIPGTPLTCHAATAMPCPSKCMVRGDALHRAISRQTHTFEILFRDRHGQTTQAVDLDVFVEPVAPDSPRNPRDITAPPAAAGETTSSKKRRGSVMRRGSMRRGSSVNAALLLPSTAPSSAAPAASESTRGIPTFGTGSTSQDPSLEVVRGSVLGDVLSPALPGAKSDANGDAGMTHDSEKRGVATRHRSLRVKVGAVTSRHVYSRPPPSTTSPLKAKLRLASLQAYPKALASSHPEILTS